jgi:hypothetical protein
LFCRCLLNFPERERKKKKELLLASNIFLERGEETNCVGSAKKETRTNEGGKKFFDSFIADALSVAGKERKKEGNVFFLQWQQQQHCHLAASLSSNFFIGARA